jgi:hypothetical protein
LHCKTLDQSTSPPAIPIAQIVAIRRTRRAR